MVRINNDPTCPSLIDGINCSSVDDSIPQMNSNSFWIYSDIHATPIIKPQKTVDEWNDSFTGTPKTESGVVYWGMCKEKVPTLAVTNGDTTYTAEFVEMACLERSEGIILDFTVDDTGFITLSYEV